MLPYTSNIPQHYSKITFSAEHTDQRGHHNNSPPCFKLYKKTDNFPIHEVQLLQ